MTSTLQKAHPLSNGVDTSLIEHLLGQNSVPWGLALSEQFVFPVVGNEMTSNVLPVPYVASASSSFGAGNAPWEAFDGFVSPAGLAGWITVSGTPTGWLKIDLGSTKTFTQYIIAPSGNVAFESVYPKDWTFEGSNTGDFTGEETILDTQTGITGWNGLPKTFVIPSATFRYYRINITLNNGNPLYTGIEELTLGSKYSTASPSPTSYGWVALPKGSIIQPSTIVIPELLDAADAGTLEYYAAFNGAAGSWYTQAALQALSNVTVTDDEESFELYPRFNSNGSQRPTCGYLARYSVSNLTGGAGSLTPLTPSTPTSLTPLAETPPTPLTPI